MGLLDLFRKDPSQDLDKATDRLATDPVRTLELARRHSNHKDPTHRTRARSLVDQARAALLEQSLQKSAAAEAEGDFDDAADWIRAALQYQQDDSQRPDLESRLATLERRAEAEAAEEALRVPEPEVDTYEEADDDEEEDAGPLHFDDPEAQYLLLVDTYSDSLAERYEERPEEFRRAFLALNQGEPAAALPAFDRLAAAHPEDPVLHLERGRCRLMLGQPAAAREDLEVAWRELGDEPLSRDGSLTVSILWAEAALEDGDPQAVAERLGEDRGAVVQNPDLSALYASALLRSERLDDARTFLARACDLHGKRQDLAFLLGEVLRRLGERGLAIQWLERAIAPSCASGSCSKPPLHLPSLRTLAALHLEVAEEAAGEDGSAREKAAALQRVDDLMQWIAGAQGGRLRQGDFALVARHHELRGDAEAAARARERGRQAGDEEEKVQLAGAGAPGSLAGAAGESVL